MEDVTGTLYNIRDIMDWPSFDNELDWLALDENNQNI